MLNRSRTTSLFLIFQILSVALFSTFCFAGDLSLSGKLEIIHIEDQNFLNVQEHYVLETPDRQRVSLFLLESQSIGLKTGMQIQVSGESIFDSQAKLIGMWVESIEFLNVSQAYLPVTSSGTRNVLVLRVSFNDGAHDCSVADLREAVFGASGIGNYYNAISGGSLNFEPDTNGDSSSDVVNVSINHSIAEDCNDSFYANLNDWTTAADDAAQAAGYNLASYQHVFYYLPTQDGQAVNCAWAGLGSFDCGAYCRAWSAFSCSTTDVMIHEFGHNIGLQHASVDSDEDGVYATSGGSFNGSVDCEYCDVSSTMGYGGYGPRWLNAGNLDHLGWTPSARRTDLSQDGTYTIAALDTNDPASLSPAVPDQVQVLRIAHSTSGTYFISYRRNDGGAFSTGLISSQAPKVHIHFSDDERGSSFEGRTLQLAVLGVGESYTASGQFVLSNVALNDSYASVTVDLDAAGGSPGGSGTPTPTPDPGDSAAPTPTPEGAFLVQGSFTFSGMSTALQKRVLAGKIALFMLNLETLEETQVSIDPESLTFEVAVVSGAYELRVQRISNSYWKKKGLRTKRKQLLNIVGDTSEPYVFIKRKIKK